MEMGIKCSGSGSEKPERKVTEKNRRNNMKFLYSQLFSLIPPDLISKGGDHVSDRLDAAIHYIHTLKTSLETSNNKKEKLMISTRKRSYQHTKPNILCKSLHIQIHEITPQVDAVLVTGLNNHSNFCHVLELLDEYSSEVAVANFSSSGHSTFHVRHKKIEAREMCERIKILIEGPSSIKELEDKIEVGSNSTIWDLDWDFQRNLWGWELEMLAMTMTT